MAGKKRSEKNDPMTSASSAPTKPVALTLKIDQEMYIRLSILRARDRKTAQDILVEALAAHLQKVGM